MQVNAGTFLNDHRAALEQIAPHFAPSAHKDRTPLDIKVRDNSEAASIDKIKAILEEHNISLQFSTDTITHAVVVKLVDEKTGEAIRQFPTEVSLRLAANFLRLQGHFINATK